MGTLLPRVELAHLVAERQASGERAVFTNGIFDLLHLGHVAYLRRARSLCDFLVVGLNSDPSARRLKGPRRPLVPETERAELLAALTCVDYVTIFGENTAEALVAALRPALYVKGGDYAGGSPTGDVLLDAEELRRDLADLERRLPEARAVAAYGGALALLAYLPGHSTTELIERIVQRYGAPEAGQSIQDTVGTDEQ